MYMLYGRETGNQSDQLRRDECKILFAIQRVNNPANEGEMNGEFYF